MYIDRPCQSCNESIYRLCLRLGSQRHKLGKMGVVDCGKQSIFGVFHVLKIRVRMSGWRLHSVIIGWFGRDWRSAITFWQPWKCLALKEMSWDWRYRKRSTSGRNRVRKWGEWVPLYWLIQETTLALFGSDHDLVALKGPKLPLWVPNNWYGTCGLNRTIYPKSHVPH